jgi:hypothetical protein
VAGSSPAAGSTITAIGRFLFTALLVNPSRFEQPRQYAFILLYLRRLNIPMEENRQVQEKNQKQLMLSKTFGFAVEFGFVIALPLIAFIYAGKYLDSRYHTKYFALLGVLFALFLSTSWLYRRMKSIFEDLKRK